eukprot:93422-Rhodomonas_salina.1
MLPGWRGNRLSRVYGLRSTVGSTVYGLRWGLVVWSRVQGLGSRQGSGSKMFRQLWPSIQHHNAPTRPRPEMPRSAIGTGRLHG